MCSSGLTETPGPALPAWLPAAVRRERSRDCSSPSSCLKPQILLDGVARRGAAPHPKAGSSEKRRGGEEEPTDGVQVGIPHTDFSVHDREDETASAAGFLTTDLFSDHFQT